MREKDFYGILYTVKEKIDRRGFGKFVMPIEIRPVRSSSLTSLLRNINENTDRLQLSVNRLSSAQRINRAADDAAGLAISEQFRADISSTRQAIQNVNAGTALINTAEGGLSQISNLLTRGRELAVQAANGTLSDEQRGTLNREFNAIRDEINRISSVTEFNGQPLLNGDLGPNAAEQVNVQAGIDAGPANQINLNVVDATDAGTLGLNNLNISTAAGAQNALGAIDNAIQTVTGSRASLGAVQNRLESAGQTLGVSLENFTAAESNIRDLDFASEISNFGTNNLLTGISVTLLNRASLFQQSLVGGLFQGLV
jgi:flagellin